MTTPTPAPDALFDADLHITTPRLRDRLNRVVARDETGRLSGTVYDPVIMRLWDCPECGEHGFDLALADPIAHDCPANSRLRPPLQVKLVRRSRLDDVLTRAASVGGANA